MAKRKGRPPEGRPPELTVRRAAEARDRDADRAAFEQALERLDSTAHREKLEQAEQAGTPERGPRFAKRVRRGEIEPAASIDLHGLDRESAVQRLRRFLATAPGDAILVIHGRGAGVLKAVAIVELDRHPRVAEHLVAPRDLGGEGARLVRLRRS